MASNSYDPTAQQAHTVLAELGLQVFERGWLSSNNIFFKPTRSSGAMVVDTGYSAHAPMTLSLLREALQGAPLERIVNPPLHSDHCGGNAPLQAAHLGCETWLPASSFDAVNAWDLTELTYQDIAQHCDRYRADHAIGPGSTLDLGAHRWQALAAPGHDPHALMFFQPEAKVLIAGDALWEDRVAIIFPELEGQSGFDEAQALDCIAALEPAVVVPGHGSPFTDVQAAIAQSRSRLARYQAQPASHLRYALRALVMFHMLQGRRMRHEDLLRWVDTTPMFQRMARPSAQAVVAELVSDGNLLEHEGWVSVP